MIKKQSTRPPVSGAEEITAKTYVLGYVVSMLFTLTAYVLAVNHLLTRDWLLFDLAVLAVTQFIVQLLCFLHIGIERQPKWKLMVFGLMLAIVLILVIGTLWIMANLNYHMPHDVKTYLHQNEGL